MIIRKINFILTRAIPTTHDSCIVVWKTLVGTWSLSDSTTQQYRVVNRHEIRTIFINWNSNNVQWNAPFPEVSPFNGGILLNPTRKEKVDGNSDTAVGRRMQMKLKSWMKGSRHTVHIFRAFNCTKCTSAKNTDCVPGSKVGTIF